MIAKGRTGAEITDRDLRRVMDARRALHAYEPYAPTTRSRALRSRPRARRVPATSPAPPPAAESR